jgi:hypothetical protein
MLKRISLSYSITSLDVVSKKKKKRMLLARHMFVPVFDNNM